MLSEIYEACRLDALLIPIGLLAALAAADAPAAALLVLPLVALLARFARERDAGIAQTLELGRAYRGTALLLCDLLEDDDEYTGHHTQDVVELSVKRRRPARRRRGRAQRETELGALLHDIGKIHIPDAIINKPGPLDDEEWALMKTHTRRGPEDARPRRRAPRQTSGSSSAPRTSASTAAATRTAWRARRFRSRRGSWPSATPSTP